MREHVQCPFTHNRNAVASIGNFWCLLEAMDTHKKGGKKWLNQLEAAVAVKVAVKEAETVEVPVCPAKPGTLLVDVK